ncbi:MAG: hypothetical protein KDM81_14340, partial [Verrucomicrobiae bacterium]|nr:hypothetical protein [Verrucomicrobiae bacterium]
MNARTRNEWRLLLPALLAGVGISLLVGGLIQFAGSSVAPGLSLVALFAVCLLLSVRSFGAEFSYGTATALWTQPVSREQLWRGKIRQLVKLVAILVVADGLI